MEYFNEGGGHLAVAALRLYKETFSGNLFDRISQLSANDPYRFTWSDIVAVTGLSVSVDVEAAWNIVHKDGVHTQKLSELLLKLDPALKLRDAKEGDLAPAYEMWNLLKKEKGMGGGGVVLSKLLAAKRPHLLPIRDEYVLNALFHQTKFDKKKGVLKFDTGLDDWAPWAEYLNDEQKGSILSSAAEAAASDADYTPEISVLRTVDIVVWMRHWGCFDKGILRPGLPQEFQEPPSF